MRPARQHRSELVVPATNLRALEKAHSRGSDVVLIDLEDSVVVDSKEQARANAIAAIQMHTWSPAAVSVRVNGLGTPWCYGDVISVVEATGDVLGSVLLPKAETPSDVEFLGTLLDQIEVRQGFQPGRVGISVLIETAKGLTNVEAIARARPDRLEAMAFGAADYAASTGARTTNIGGANPNYTVLTDPDSETLARAEHWGDQWHYALSRLVAACRAEGLCPIDGAFGDLGDPDGYRSAASRAAALGCEGKWAIHPSQVPLANELFSPTESELERAEAIMKAMEAAAEQGKGAASLEGHMIDAASIRMAENVLARTVTSGPADRTRPANGHR